MSPGGYFSIRQVCPAAAHAESEASDVLEVGFWPLGTRHLQMAFVDPRFSFSALVPIPFPRVSPI